MCLAAHAEEVARCRRILCNLFSRAERSYQVAEKRNPPAQSMLQDNAINAKAKGHGILQYLIRCCALLVHVCGAVGVGMY